MKYFAMMAALSFSLFGCIDNETTHTQNQTLGFKSGGSGGGGGGKGLPGDIGDPGGACDLVDPGYTVSQFYDYGDQVMYVMSFPHGGTVLPAQLVLTIDSDETSSVNFAFPGADAPTLLLIHPNATGVDSYLPTAGTMSISGVPGSGQATFSFRNLKMAEYDSGDQDFVEDGMCLAFYDFLVETCGAPLVSISGAANGFYDQGPQVQYVKSFDFGFAVDAQMVITLDANATGDFQIGDDEVSVSLLQVQNNGVDSYIATHGRVSIDGVPSSGSAEISLEDLRLYEVNGTALVEDGACVPFYDFSIEGSVKIPPGWTCNQGDYTDDTCHCGCGVVDPACKSTGNTTCEVCNSSGSCAAKGQGCLEIDPNNGGLCVEICNIPRGDSRAFEYTTYQDLETVVLSNSCVVPGCHANNGISLADGDLQNFVTDCDPASSPLWANEVDPGAMPPNPSGIPPLSDSEKLMFKNWILSGTP